VDRKTVGLDERIVRTGKSHEDGKGQLLVVHLSPPATMAEYADLSFWPFSRITGARVVLVSSGVGGHRG
jgi:hypothetical protein